MQKARLFAVGIVLVVIGVSVASIFRMAQTDQTMIWSNTRLIRCHYDSIREWGVNPNFIHCPVEIAISADALTYADAKKLDQTEPAPLLCRQSDWRREGFFGGTDSGTLITRCSTA